MQTVEYRSSGFIVRLTIVLVPATVSAKDDRIMIRSKLGKCQRYYPPGLSPKVKPESTAMILRVSQNPSPSCPIQVISGDLFGWVMKQFEADVVSNYQPKLNIKLKFDGGL